MNPLLDHPNPYTTMQQLLLVANDVKFAWNQWQQSRDSWACYFEKI